MMNDDNELSESELPDFIRIGEDDGSITVVCTADATTEQLERYGAQAEADGAAYATIGREIRRVALAEHFGQVPKGTALAYLRKQQPVIKGFTRLYDFSN